MAGQLRAVGADEKAAPKSAAVAAESGTTRELLVAMRTRVAKAVDDEKTSARDLAALTRRLSEITKDIEAIDALEAPEGGDGGDSHGDVDETFDAEAL